VCSDEVVHELLCGRTVAGHSDTTEIPDSIVTSNLDRDIEPKA